MTTVTRTDLAAVWPPTAEAAELAGHERKSPLKAIRAKCLDCSAGAPSEARKCEAIECALWPFRAGRHPWFGLGSVDDDDLGESPE